MPITKSGKLDLKGYAKGNISLERERRLRKQLRTKQIDLRGRGVEEVLSDVAAKLKKKR